MIKKSSDKELKRNFKKLMDFYYSKYGGLIEELSMLNIYLEKVYGISKAIPDEMMERIMDEVIKINFDREDKK